MSKDYIKKIVDDVDNAELGTEASVSNWASTGSYAINKIISNSFVRGLPFNRVVEIFGDPSTGKSLLIYHLIANVQKMGGVAILDDTEDAYTPEFGKMIGINNQELIRLSSLTVEEHFEKVFLGWKSKKKKNKDDEEYEDTKSKAKAKPSLVQMILDEEPNCLILVALDSLALLSTKHEQTVLFEKPDMIKAKQIRAGLRMCSDIVKKNNILHVISNHVTAKIGVLYGPKKTTPGGSGVPFQASVRLDLSLRGKILDDNENVIGVQSKVHVAKNRISAPFKKAIVDIKFDRGVVKESGLYDVLLNSNTIQEEGADIKRGFFKYGEEQFRKSEFDAFLSTHKEILEK